MPATLFRNPLHGFRLLSFGRNRPTVQPERLADDRCAGGKACRATDNPFSDDPRKLPYGREQLARCEVPPQAEPVYVEGAPAPRAAPAVRDARPDLMPVYCFGEPDSGRADGWWHSVCYSTHVH